MAMGGRTDRTRTSRLWFAANELPATGGHPYYQQLNQVLDAHAFDEFVESQCAAFYATRMGLPSLTPGMYFRLLLIGYFEGIDSERGIAWRTADSLALRGMPRVAAAIGAASGALGAPKWLRIGLYDSPWRRSPR